MLSLFIGVVTGALIARHTDPVASAGMVGELFATLLTTAWVLKTLAFAVLVGSVMRLISVSGGVAGFVTYVTRRRSLVHSQRSALLLTYGIGIAIFIESSITSLIAGAVGRPLADRYGASRAKLAYICDSTSAPVCSLITLNGWGALLMGLISTQIAAGMLEGESVSWLLHALPFNIYAWVALLSTLVVIWYGIDIGPMRRSRAVPERDDADSGGRADYMVLPVVLMVALVLVVLLVTGEGNILHGSGSTALFYSTSLSVLFCVVYYAATGGMKVRESLRHALAGAWSMVPIAAVLLLAFAISDVTKILETGLYIASFARGNIDPAWLAGIIFLLGSGMAFATGTSWGTFSIMIPIAVPLAVTLGADPALCIGAVISGGVFGDHCSPISDTTIISSMAAGCDHVEHVNTQLPYALFSGLVSLILFVIIGWLF